MHLRLKKAQQQANSPVSNLIIVRSSGSHHCPEAGSVPRSIVPSGITEVGPLMAADEMHQLSNETTGYRDRGASVSACVRDQRTALFHTQSRTTTYHVRREALAVAFDSVVKMMNIALCHLSTNEMVLNPNVSALKQQRGLGLLH
jgi:hypothetical protein